MLKNEPELEIRGMPLTDCPSSWAFLQPELLDQMHDSVITTRMDGTITSCNKTATSVYGYTAEEMIGQSVTMLYPPEDRSYLGEILVPQVMEKKCFSGEVRNQRKTGSYIYVNLSVGLLYDNVGKPCGMVGFSIDVTAQKLAGIEGRGRFEALTHAIPQLVWWADKDGQTNYVTSRTTGYFGVPMERLLGDRWFDYVHPEDREKSRSEWKGAVRELRQYEREHRLRRHDGEYILHLARGLPIFDTAGEVTGYVRTSTDVSARMLAENALRQSEKLAVVGKLASSISHEINNPLEAVTNLLYLLGSNPSLNRTAREYVKAAEEEAARMSEIVRQALRFHRQATAEAPVRIADVMDSVLSVFKPRIDAAGLTLFREYRRTETVTCFVGEIRQVLSNLLSNALDATPPGGRIVARLRPAQTWGARPMLGVRIVLADTGRGIPKEARRRIYEPFYTTKGINGTGLGMWISKDLVEKHEGSIRFRSSTRHDASGTVFSIFLPYESFRTVKGEIRREPQDETIPRL